LLDYILPSLGAKYFGASKYGIWGSFIGMFAGIFLFPPWGMIAGIISGAVIGELIAGQSKSQALKAGAATFILSILMIVLKLILSVIMTFYFIAAAVKSVFW
jgi:uncharacterized protein YqgC (DUF456 family)